MAVQTANSAYGWEDDVDSHFFSVLPFGLRPDCDMTGWASDAPAKSGGSIRVIKDLELKYPVIELQSKTAFTKVAVTFPDTDEKYIGTPLPVLVLHLKNIGSYVGFEIEVEDTDGQSRFISASNAQSVVRLKNSECSLPLKLTDGWNNVTLNLQELTSTVFNATYKHTNRIRVFANCRLRRVFFSDREYLDYELPPELRVFHFYSSTAETRPTPASLFSPDKSLDASYSQAAASIRRQSQASIVIHPPPHSPLSALAATPNTVDSLAVPTH